MCFQLPTIPKFRSLILIFLILVFGFLQLLILLAEKCFQFRVYFFWKILKLTLLKKCFCNICTPQTTPQPRSNCWPMKMKEQQAVTPCEYFKQIKLFQKIKSNPTYQLPNFKKHVIENTHIFLFGLKVINFYKLYKSLKWQWRQKLIFKKTFGKLCIKYSKTSFEKNCFSAWASTLTAPTKG